MGEDSISIAEKSESIKHDIEDCYRGAIKYLELYNNALLRRAGNHKLYYAYFVSKFQSLYYFTRVDTDMKLETIEKVDGNAKQKQPVDADNPEKGKQEEEKKHEKLLPAVDGWFKNGATDRERGVELFLVYGDALFSNSVLSFKK